MEARAWFRMHEPPAGAHLKALLDFAAARRAHYPTFLLVQREIAPGQSGDAAAFASHASPPPAHTRKRSAHRGTADLAFDRDDPADSSGASDVREIDSVAARRASASAASERDDADGSELPDLVELLDSLEPHLVTQATTDRWPGAAPGETRARVLFYRLDHQSALALAKVSSLAAFVPPLLEDLCILASDKTPWLLTWSRMQRFLLHLTHEEERAVAKGLPWLRLEREPNPPELGRES